MSGLRPVPPPPESVHLTDDQCLDLVHGLTDPDERAAWLDHAGRCSRCEALLATHVDALERARRTLPPAEATVPGPSYGGPAERPIVATRPQRSRTAGWIGAAAAVAVAVSGLLIVAKRPSPMLSELRRLPAADEWVVTRTLDDPQAPPALVEALLLYADGDDRAAVPMLASLAVEERFEPVRRAYLGSALAHLGRLDDARRELGNLAGLPEPWDHETAWTRVIAALGTGNRSEADSLLVRFESEWPHLRERVEDLRARLRKGGGP